MCFFARRRSHYFAQANPNGSDRTISHNQTLTGEEGEADGERNGEREMEKEGDGDG